MHHKSNYASFAVAQPAILSGMDLKCGVAQVNLVSSDVQGWLGSSSATCGIVVSLWPCEVASVGYAITGGYLSGDGTCAPLLNGGIVNLHCYIAATKHHV